MPQHYTLNPELSMCQEEKLKYLTDAIADFEAEC